MERKRKACFALSFLVLGGCLSTAISSSFAHRDNVQYLQMALPTVTQTSTLTSNYLVVGGQTIVLEWSEARKKEEPSTDGTDNVEQTNPTEGSTAPTEPTNPTEGSTAPTEPTNPTEGCAASTEPTNPTEGSTAPTEPTNPTEGSTAPTEPTNPTEGETTQTEPNDPSQNEEGQLGESTDEDTNKGTNEGTATETTPAGDKEAPADDAAGENGETATAPTPGESEIRYIYKDITLTAPQNAVSGTLSVSSENLTAQLGDGNGRETKSELQLTISAGETVKILLIIIEENATEEELEPVVELVWTPDDGTPEMSATFLLREPEEVAVPEDRTDNFVPVKVSGQCSEEMPLALKFTDNWELTLLWKNDEQIEETAGKFPAGTRYYLDGSWTVLAEAGVIHCKGEAGKYMLLDIPQSPDSNTLYALAEMSEGDYLTFVQEVTYVKQQERSAPLVLEENGSLTLENWSMLNYVPSLSRLDRVGTGVDWSSISSEQLSISPQNDYNQLEVRMVPEVLLPAGTYRLEFVWYFEEIEVKRTQTVFYILYPTLNGGATP